ncbi:MAG: alpha/beta hydrolase, partial [Bifidobacteriaceae bacterium]|nr:alpha/beta hydrolase [Bifidobacteriaceae bacterium]
AVPAAAAPAADDGPRLAALAPTARTKAVQWYYDQEVEWGDCTEKGLECATIKAPLKWTKPGGRKITIAIARDKAKKQPAASGAILVNPGGPGASGIDSLAVLSSMFGAKVKARYDIVGFDPRGVGASSAVRCTAKTSQMHRHLAEWFPNTHDGRVAAKKAARSWGNQCRKLTGPLLGQVDTVSAAKDMDIIRAVLGQSTLSYVGWSYGSKLGAVYAELFPKRVGRLVLDGAINPAADAGAAAAAQLKGFEDSLGAWAEDCVAQGACAIGGTVPEVLTAVHDLLARCGTEPLPTATKGRRVTTSLAFVGVLMTLYDNAYWPLLTLGLANAIHGNDGSVLLMLADAYNSFDGQRYANNMLTANQAINCLDYPSADSTQAQTQVAIDAAIAQAPVLGEFWMGNGISQCAHWPYRSTATPHAVKSTTKAPILVIGTTGDPATPYTNAIELTKQLRTATLLTFQGEGHTAFGRGNACVNAVVNRYLLTGKVPREGRICR